MIFRFVIWPLIGCWCSIFVSACRCLFCVCCCLRLCSLSLESLSWCISKLALALLVQAPEDFIDQARVKAKVIFFPNSIFEDDFSFEIPCFASIIWTQILQTILNGNDSISVMRGHSSGRNMQHNIVEVACDVEVDGIPIRNLRRTCTVLQDTYSLAKFR